MYDKVKLDAADAKTMRDLSDKQFAVQQFVQTVQQQGEQRMAELKANSRETWAVLKDKYSLDLQHVTYNLDDDGTHLVPIAVRLDDV